MTTVLTLFITDCGVLLTDISDAWPGQPLWQTGSRQTSTTSLAPLGHMGPTHTHLECCNGVLVGAHGAAGLGADLATLSGVLGHGDVPPGAVLANCRSITTAHTYTWGWLGHADDGFGTSWHPCKHGAARGCETCRLLAGGF